MHPNLPPHLINESGQYYYAAPVQQSNNRYAEYPNQTWIYPQMDQRYVMSTPQRQPPHLVMPVGQSPVIIVASPAGPAYPSPIFPPGNQPVYYQDASLQQSQMMHHVSHTRSNGPLMTSTPLPTHRDFYNTSGGSRDGSNRRFDRRPKLDMVEEISRISIDDNTDEAPVPMHARNQYNFMQQRGREQYHHRPARKQESYGTRHQQQSKVHFAPNLPRRQGQNWNQRRTEPAQSLLRNRNIAGSMGCLASVDVGSSAHQAQPVNRGMWNSYPARSVIGLNNFTDS